VKIFIWLGIFCLLCCPASSSETLDYSMTLAQVEASMESTFKFKVKGKTLDFTNVVKPKGYRALHAMVDETDYVLAYLATNYLSYPLWSRFQDEDFDPQIALAWMQGNQAFRGEYARLVHAWLRAHGGGISDFTLEPLPDVTWAELLTSGASLFKPKSTGDGGYLCVFHDQQDPGTRKQLMLEGLCYSAVKLQKSKTKKLKKIWSNSYMESLAQGSTVQVARGKATDALIASAELHAVLEKEYNRLSGMLPFALVAETAPQPGEKVGHSKP